MTAVLVDEFGELAASDSVELLFEAGVFGVEGFLVGVASSEIEVFGRVGDECFFGWLGGGDRCRKGWLLGYENWDEGATQDEGKRSCLERGHLGSC